MVDRRGCWGGRDGAKHGDHMLEQIGWIEGEATAGPGDLGGTGGERWVCNQRHPRGIRQPPWASPVTAASVSGWARRRSVSSDARSAPPGAAPRLPYRQSMPAERGTRSAVGGDRGACRQIQCRQVGGAGCQHAIERGTHQVLLIEFRIVCAERAQLGLERLARPGFAFQAACCVASCNPCRRPSIKPSSRAHATAAANAASVPPAKMATAGGMKRRLMQAGRTPLATRPSWPARCPTTPLSRRVPAPCVSWRHRTGHAKGGDAGSAEG